MDILCRKNFGNKVMKNLKSVDIQRLPPTEDAAKYHSYRVYLQTQVWMGNTDIMPENSGWKVQCGHLVPQTMDSKPVPDVVSKLIRYKCKALL